MRTADVAKVCLVRRLAVALVLLCALVLFCAPAVALAFEYAPDSNTLTLTEGETVSLLDVSRDFGASGDRWETYSPTDLFQNDAQEYVSYDADAHTLAGNRETGDVQLWLVDKEGRFDPVSVVVRGNKPLDRGAITTKSPIASYVGGSEGRSGSSPIRGSWSYVNLLVAMLSVGSASALMYTKLGHRSNPGTRMSPGGTIAVAVLSAVCTVIFVTTQHLGAATVAVDRYTPFMLACFLAQMTAISLGSRSEAREA